MPPVSPKWANPNHGRFKRSQREEKRVAQSLDGRALPRSGGVRAASGPDAPTLDGDFRTRTLHGEHKRTALAEVTVQYEWFLKVTQGAHRALRVPVVVLLFERFEGVSREWIFFPLAYFQNLTGCASDPSKYRGDVREVTARSFIFKAHRAEELVQAAPPPAIPTVALVWECSKRPDVRTWVGAPLDVMRPLILE